MINIKKILEKNKLKNQSVYKIKKSLRIDFYNCFILIVVWTFLSFIAIAYSYSLDPVLSLVALSIWFGMTVMLNIIILIYKRLYIYLRVLSDEIEYEGGNGELTEGEIGEE